MSLVKKPHLTEKKLAANRRNQRLSHGLVTAAGRQRIRAAHLRHGFYSKAESVALRALGEDPAEFQSLLKQLRATWKPTDALQEELLCRLARAFWRMKRADRMQEGLALQQAQDVNRGRQARFAERLVALRITWAGLQALATKVAQKGYVTTTTDFKMMENLCRLELKEEGELALALFRQLRKPGTLEFAEATEGEMELTPEEEEARRRRVMNSIRDIFALPPLEEPEEDEAEANAEASSDQAAVPPGPGTEVEPEPEEDPQRAQVRQLLAFLLERLAAVYEVRSYSCLVDAKDGPSAFERAAEAAPAQPHEALARMEVSAFRQVSRLTGLLMRLKRQARELETM